MILEQMSLEAALRAREEGMATAVLRSDILWREGVKAAIQRLADAGAIFTADDVRTLAGDPPPGFSPNAMGGVIAGEAKRGVIRMAGYTKSARIIGHGNLVRQWVGA